MRVQERRIKYKIEQLSGFDDIFFRSRKKERFICRAVFCTFVRKFGSFSTEVTTFQSLGDMLGVTHSNIINMVNNFDHILKFEPYARKLWDELLEWYRDADLPGYNKDLLEPKKEPSEVDRVLPHVKSLLDKLENKAMLGEIINKLETSIIVSNKLNERNNNNRAIKTESSFNTGIV